MFIFLFNIPATPEIYTLSLHDALPICRIFLSAAIALAVELGREHQIRDGRALESLSGQCARSTVHACAHNYRRENWCHTLACHDPAGAGREPADWRCRVRK